MKLKKTNQFKNENSYIYVQIIITIIFVISSLILKNNDSTAFYTLKEDYQIFFTTETIYESNFSNNNFVKKITEDLKTKYTALTQTIAYLYGKGKSDIYPSNISFEKYTPEEKEFDVHFTLQQER